ncbi:phospholipase D-like domain-containing protein [Niveibacterium sp. SC-1]|uniref:phospholipase D-like domain-containing protein n=1 Tax=Niveibacterium sp. SC-1 TaxID=3135646 RepID=UPI00311E827B
MVTHTEPPPRTAKQLVKNDGTPLASALTSNLWVGSSTVFSRPTEGNKIIPFTTGRDYFADFTASCDKASSEICILGWQVSWDALLAPGVRLYDVLLRAAKRGVKIYVMPWDDTNPVQTYDDQTKAVLESINTRPGVSGNPVNVLLAKSLATKNNSYFSHHQKQVIIDRAIAYVGGIDITYGRYDDSTYDLHANKDGREVLNRYNGCIAWVQPLATRDPNVVDPDLMSGAIDSFKVPYFGKSAAESASERAAKGGWQVPYDTAPADAVGASYVGAGPSTERNVVLRRTLNPATQPRMPWQDLHSRIEGPAVSDLLRNFVVRWNTGGKIKLPMPQAPAKYPKPGKALIQVLRSAPAAMAAAEYNALASKKGTRTPAGTESDIQKALLQLIEKSRHFIYIENQFFVSNFGAVGGPLGALSPAAEFINTFGGANQNSTAHLMGAADTDGHIKPKLNGWKPSIDIDDSDLHRPPSNEVCKALVARIGRAILDAKKPNFHVYITLPVHPEGMLCNASIAVQVYWTMQTLVFGKKSLLNGIRRYLRVRELQENDRIDKKARDYSSILNDENNAEYEGIPLERCFEYVTLLNLRNWAKLPGTKSGDARYVTEQIYVHTKLMIIDDLYALFGSANINDRSLLGERDSEIAVLVMDGDTTRADINGKGSQRPIRAFAHELRISIWKKLFGIAGGIRPATDLVSAIEAPGSPDSWRRIQARADRNAAAYEAAFPFVPRNWSKDANGVLRKASILPTWDPEANFPATSKNTRGKGNLASPMPFQPEFWSSPQHDATAVGQLEDIQGFITALPIHWTEEENIGFAYPTSLVAENEPAGDLPAGSPPSTGPLIGKFDPNMSGTSVKANA